jgi:hypothetical protein
VSAEVLARRAELLAKLQGEEQTNWQRLSQTMGIGEIEEFAVRLKEIARAGAWPELSELAASLQQQTQDLDLDRLPVTLRKYPEVCAQLDRKSRETKA